jgi:hypothetical protein
MRSLLSSKETAHLRAVLAFSIIVLGILLAYYYPIYGLGRVYYTSDHSLYFEPFARFIGESYKQMRLPLWNPYVYTGMPQIAVPSPGCFYPFNLIFAFLPYGRALAIILLLHQVIAGVGGFLFASSLRMGRAGAFTAGFCCAFSGYMFSLSSNHTLATTAAWVPITMWLLREIRVNTLPRQLYPRVLGASLAMAMLLLCGRPEVSAAAMTLLLAFSVVQSFRPLQPIKEEETSHNFGWQMVAFFTAVLLSMPSVLPTVEWVTASPRSTGMDVKYVFMWSANWYDLLMMVFAQPFGDLQALGSPYLGLAASRSGHWPFLPSTLIGPVALTLAIWGFADRKWSGRLWVLAVFVASMIMVVGEYTYFMPKLFALFPAATFFRYPIKLVIIPLFCLALAAANGMHALGAGHVGRKTMRATLALWAISLSIGGAFFVAGMTAHPIPIGNLVHRADAETLLGRALIFGAIFGLSTLGIASLSLRRRIKFRSAATAINTFLAFSLCLPAFCFQPHTVPESFYTRPRYVAEKLKTLGADIFGRSNSERALPLYFEPLKKTEKYTQGEHASANYNYFAYCYDMLLPNTNIDGHINQTFGYEAAETRDFHELVLDGIHDAVDHYEDETKEDEDGVKDCRMLARVCRSSATSVVLTQINNDEGKVPHLDPEFFDLKENDDKWNLRIYRVRNPLPRAFIANKFKWFEKHGEVLKLFNSDAGGNFDPIENASIEKLPADTSSYSVLLPTGCVQGAGDINLGIPDSPANSDAVYTQNGYIVPAKTAPTGAKLVDEDVRPQLLKDFPDEISISVGLSKPGFLILSDHYYPGWTAMIDGVQAPIFRANGIFRAVYLPKGSHLVQFDYLPQSLVLGAYGALSGALIILLLLLCITGPPFWRMLKRSAGQDV